MEKQRMKELLVNMIKKGGEELRKEKDEKDINDIEVDLLIQMGEVMIDCSIERLILREMMEK
nr:MAG TPA: hypothetical protein [Caudoviricetes sp.]